MLDERLDKIEKLSNDTNMKVAVIESRQCVLVTDLHDISKTIYGNGNQGLVTQVALIWQKVALISVTIGFTASAIATIIIGFIRGK